MRFGFFSAKAPPPPKAPPAAWGQTFSEVVSTDAALKADVRRGQYLNVILGISLLSVTGALTWIATHHIVQPYVLTAGHEGSIQLARETVVPYEPGTPEKHYFVAQWVKHLMSLDSALSEHWLKEAYQQTRGKASVEFTDWVKQQAPLQALKSDPSLTRTVTISSVSLLEHDIALVRINTERRSLANPSASINRWLVTLHITTQPPSDEESILKNPIGLLVTDFQIGEDLDK